MMKKVIVNKSTLALARRQTLLAFRECYLNLQLTLLSCFNSVAKEEKNKWAKLIEETGQNYKEVMEAQGISREQTPAPK